MSLTREEYCTSLRYYGQETGEAAFHLRHQLENHDAAQRAEIERLKEEHDELKARVAQEAVTPSQPRHQDLAALDEAGRMATYYEQCDTASQKDIDKLQAEIERLTRENEMLRKGWPDFTKLQADLAACRAELESR